ncbi:hypothetical protein JTB14_005364 [Gonioctena quinquepunctata]|nr:hypothetical protein JTB14_005364 [Gonioctena quinquepunctata]
MVLNCTRTDSKNDDVAQRDMQIHFGLEIREYAQGQLTGSSGNKKPWLCLLQKWSILPLQAQQQNNYLLRQSVLHEKWEHRQLKHVDVKYNFVRDPYNSEEIDIKLIESKEQKGDLLTNSLTMDHFMEMESGLGIFSLDSMMLN